MQSKPLVSIVINNYNYENFLSEAIESALSQTYQQIEVIVVDDGSSDHSCEVIQQYSDCLIAVFQENGKQAIALNRGFALSRGEIIIFLDADDYLYPDAVESVVASWKPNVAKVHYRLTVVDSCKQPLGYSLPQGGQPLSRGQVWQTLLERGGYRGVPMSGNAIAQAVLAQVFPIPVEYRLTADDYLSTLVPFYGEVIAIDQPLGIYRIHDRNQWAIHTVTGSRFRRFLEQFLVKKDILGQKALQLGYNLPKDWDLRTFGHWWVRLASYRLAPQDHPIASDNTSFLITRGIIALWQYSGFNLLKRLIYSFWFIVVGFLPKSLATTAITWLFIPYKRPQLQPIKSLMQNFSMFYQRLKRFWQSPTVQQNLLKALLKRLWWRIRWRIKHKPLLLSLGENLKITIPKTGSGAAIFYQGFSEPETADFLLHFLKPGMVFVDVGAHIGEYTLLAAQTVSFAGEVHSFEPLPTIYPILQQNIALNSLTNVVLHQIAVSDYDGEIEFEVSSEPATSSIRKLATSTDKRQFITVNSLKLDTYWSDQSRKIDLIKVDVEGAEKLVFHGSGQLLTLPITEAPTCIFEYAPANYARFGYAPQDILTLFKERGYEVYQYLGAGKIKSLNPSDPLPDIVNAIATKDLNHLLTHLKSK
ncbi:MAG: FkbM family methyltransferase [Cyanobacteria bacterium J083]|nr:MAG: FkbM family methyltransferase [Cyanobacteria bacterium J083]